MKHLHKNQFLLALYAGLALSIPASNANASKLNEWFPQIFGPPPEKITGPKPEDTLESPFKTDTSKPQGKNFLSDLKTDDVKKEEDLAKRHRTPDQIGEWLGDVVAQTLTMQTSTLPEHAASIVKNFTTTGAYEINNFITETNVIDVMEKYNVRLLTITNSAPQLENEAPVNGYYSWLYTVPVTMTYIPLDFTGYNPEELETKDTSFRAVDVDLSIQVRRVKEKLGEHSVKIELWRKADTPEVITP